MHRRRVRPDEKRYFEAAAARDGYADSTAAWLERAARAAAEQTEPGRDEQLDELINAVTDTHDALRRIGHNMNQVARAWNTLASGADTSTDPLAVLHHTALTELGAALRTTDRVLGTVLDHLTPHRPAAALGRSDTRRSGQAHADRSPADPPASDTVDRCGRGPSAADRPGQADGRSA